MCTLEQVGQTFLCDLEFAAAGDCQAAVSDSVRREFLQRMTSISLQLLYLDGERGATPPFRYNQIDQVLSDITVQSCSSSGAGSCRCRLAYQDSELLQIFYDSAGCRRSSRFMRHPLYFEGEGCR
ncbi:MAG: hypothetical protein K1X75_10555 [Leptospirales bacterium]|nr:hypothetical protein [Leptospirales bacterium]